MAVKCIDSKRDFELVEVKTSDDSINAIANRYIIDRHLNVIQSTGFNCLLLYLSQNYVSNNIDRLDVDNLIYWFNIYVELCALCDVLPDLTGYSIFTSIPYDTIKDWQSGQNRRATHTQIIKKFNEFCKMSCVTEAGRGNVGAMYVSKALHGLSDSPPSTQYTQNVINYHAPMSIEDRKKELLNLLE